MADEAVFHLSQILQVAQSIRNEHIAVCFIRYISKSVNCGWFLNFSDYQMCKIGFTEKWRYAQLTYLNTFRPPLSFELKES